jgi:hypothetical protein
MKTVVSVEGAPVGSGVGLVSKCSVVVVLEASESCRGRSAPARNLELQVREGDTVTFELLLEKRGAGAELFKLFFGDLIAGELERAYR